MWFVGFVNASGYILLLICEVLKVIYAQQTLEIEYEVAGSVNATTLFGLLFCKVLRVFMHNKHHKLNINGIQFTYEYEMELIGVYI